MRRVVRLVCSVALMAIALVASPGAASAGTAEATARRTILAFALIGPNTAIAPDAGMMTAPGDQIEVTGGGTFAPATGAIHAGGRFTRRTADGAVHCRGAWFATGLTGWTDFGAGRHGTHGGVVAMLVTHRCATMGEVHTDIPMVVTSTRVAPPGSAAVEGVTVGEFTRPTGGVVAIFGLRGRS